LNFLYGIDDRRAYKDAKDDAILFQGLKSVGHCDRGVIRGLDEVEDVASLAVGSAGMS
jgi:hypothetical protein